MVKEKKRKELIIVFTSMACCSGNSLQSWIPDELIQTPAPRKKELFKQEI